MSTARDSLIIAAVAIASGGAGWWGHAAVEARRMRRMLAQVQAEIARHIH